MISRLRVFISGRVQGVFYRAWAKNHAERLDLTGYARNLPDGRVKIVAEGEKQNLQKFLSPLKQGPPLARVEKVEASWGKTTGEFPNFSVL